jgi:hypothetical protein
MSFARNEFSNFQNGLFATNKSEVSPVGIQNPVITKCNATEELEAEYSSIRLEERSNSNKPPSYRCLCCPAEPLVGPIHRMNAHLNTKEHQQFHQVWVESQKMLPPQGIISKKNGLFSANQQSDKQSIESHVVGEALPARTLSEVAVEHRIAEQLKIEIPSIRLEKRGNPTAYRCLCCPAEPLVGPIYRMDAHLNTKEHQLNNLIWRDSQKINLVPRATERAQAEELLKSCVRPGF